VKALALSALVLLGACQPGRRPAPPRAVTDAIGRTVQLGAVTRIVSLAPSSTEIVFALGAGAQLVGVDRYSDFPAAARALPQVGTDMEPSLEKILALRPDLVLVATSANAQRSVEVMAQAGVPVYVSRADSLEAIFADIGGIGRALDRPRDAEALVAGMRARLAGLEARWRGSPRTTCAVVVWPSPLVVAARGSHVGDLIAAAGGLDVIGDAAQPFPSYSTERLVALAPAVLIVGTHSTGAPSMEALMRLESIPAVRDRRLHLIDGDLLFRPGPRVVDGVAALLEVLHPPPRGDGP
jgi:iron complex transport system substrate-binding protein